MRKRKVKVADDGAWARVLSHFGTPTRPREGRDGELLWLRPSEHARITVHAPRTIALVLLYPKSQFIDWWLIEKSLPPDVAVVSGLQLSDRSRLAIFGSLSRSAPTVFVGDMDLRSRCTFVGYSGTFVLDSASEGRRAGQGVHEQHSLPEAANPARAPE